MVIYLSYIDWCTILILNIREDIKRFDASYYNTFERLLENADDKQRIKEWNKIKSDTSREVKDEEIIDFFSLDLYLKHSNYLGSKHLNNKNLFLNSWKRVENFRDALGHSNTYYKDENEECLPITEDIAKERLIDILDVNTSLNLPLLVNSVDDFTNAQCFPKLKKKEENCYFVRMMIQVFVEQYQKRFNNNSDFLKILGFNKEKRENLIPKILEVNSSLQEKDVSCIIEKLFEEDKIKKLRKTRNSFFHHNRSNTHLEFTKEWIRDFSDLLKIPIRKLMDDYKIHKDDPFYDIV